MDGKGPGPGPFYFWLILTVWPARDVLDGKSHPAWAALGALLLYAGLYTGMVWSNFSSRTSLRAVGWWLAALTVVTAVSAYEFGGRWFALFPGLAIAFGVMVAALVAWIGGANGRTR